MKAEEIRNLDIVLQADKDGRITEGSGTVATFLREIAAQLVDLNARLARWDSDNREDGSYLSVSTCSED